MDSATVEFDFGAEVERIRNELLDLSLRNRLLTYKPGKQTVQIVDELPDQIFEHLVVKGNSFWFDAFEPEEPDEGDPLFDGSAKPVKPAITLPKKADTESKKHSDDRLQTNEEPDALEAKLDKARRESARAIQETGVNLLYLAIGMLEWYESAASEVAHSAPLILIPIYIDRKQDVGRKRYRYSISFTGEDLQWNHSLAFRLQQKEGIELPDFDEEVKPEAYFTAVREAIQDKPRWSVRREAIIGFFQFSKIFLFNDLNPDSWPEGKKLLDHPVVKTLLAGDDSADGGIRMYGDDYEIDGHETAESIPLIFDADSSQHSALVDIAEGKHLVIEGPPGTGKSQTIANLIASTIEQGKTVLFVAEKMAALDVVKRRLDTAGLGEFCLELHSRSSSPAKVYESLKTRLDYRPPHMRAHLQNTLEDRSVCADELKEYRDRVSEPCGPEKRPLAEVLWSICEYRSRGVPAAPVGSIPTRYLKGSYRDGRHYCQELDALTVEIGSAHEHVWRWYECPELFHDDVGSVESALRSGRDRINEHIDVVNKALELAPCDGLDNAIKLLRRIGEHEAVLRQDRPQSHLSDVGALVSGRRSHEVGENLGQLLELRHVQEQVNELRLIDDAKAVKCAEPFIESVRAGTLSESFEWTPAQLKSILAGLSNATTYCEQLQQELDRWVQLFGESIETLSDAKHLLAVLKLYDHPVCKRHGWLNQLMFDHDAGGRFVQSKKRSDGLSARRGALEEHLVLQEMPTIDECAEHIRVARVLTHDKLWFVKPSYWKTRKRFAAAFKPGTSLKPPSLLNNIESYQTLIKEIGEFAELRECKELFTDGFRGIDSDWKELQYRVAWCQQTTKLGLSAAQAIARAEQLGGLESRTPTKQIGHLFERVLTSVKDPLLTPVVAFNLLNPEDSSINEIRKSFEEAERELAETLQHAKPLYRVESESSKELLRRASLVQQRAGLEAACSDSECLQQHYPDHATETVESINSAQEELAWIDSVCRAIDDLKAAEWFITRASVEDHEQLFSLAGRFDELDAVFHGITEECAAHGRLSEDLWAEGSLEAIARIEKMLDSLPQLTIWAQYCRLRQRGVELDLDSLTLFLENGDTGTHSLEECYTLGVLSRAAKRMVGSDAAMQRFSRARHEQRRREFQESDRASQETDRVRVAKAAAAREVPQGVSHGKVGSLSELGLIRNEVKKKKRHVRIRSLVTRAAMALQGLKPCFMMSPISVAQYLPPGKIQFDLVVMDEASQIRPEDAISSVARGGQLVVVGDDKQLPPTSFFDSMGNVEESDEAGVAQGSESILGVAQMAFRTARRLKWHYRSEHESLIQYPNHRFYDGELVVFPAPVRERAELGIRFHYCEGGRYESRRNLPEAEMVVDAIIAHAHNCMKLDRMETLGVGTLNRTQCDLIEELLDKRALESGEARAALRYLEDSDEPLFIKNLENLQGDERDVIFVSKTFGPDPASGKVRNQFGPITGDTGWRRLNVLWTRSRRRLELFTSMMPTDVRVGHDTSFGTRCLREYLTFAQSGVIESPGDPNTGREPDSMFEIMVARELERMGYACVPQVGVAGYFIDIAVVDPRSPGRFLLGVECDGATYHSAKSVRDRDRLRQEVIESRGWAIHRVWSTDWWQNPETELQRLEASIQRQLKSDLV